MMDAERWARAKVVVESALEHSPTSRHAYLDAACGGDASLRKEVDSLLAAHTAAGGFAEGSPFDALPISAVADLGDSLRPGSRLGVYEITSKLGEGGMGEVYRAHDTRLDRAVAVKILPIDFAEDESRRARFAREAKAIARLTHPHICTLYDFIRADGHDVLVMELIDGETLATRLARAPNGLPVAEALTIAIALAEGIAFAHGHGVVHRDLKPANVMLTPSGVKLLDFGLALLQEPTIGGKAGGAASLSNSRTRVGTLPYMAPEQLDGHADERSDIFAFGAVLYEMLMGARAFAGESPSLLMAAILTGAPLPLREARATVSADLERLVGKCLAKDPASRWQTARDLADELRWIRERPADMATGQTRPASRGMRWLSVALPLAVLTAAAAIAFAIARSPAAPLRLDVALPLPAGTSLPGTAPGIALSPDGTAIVYVGLSNGERRLFLRRLEAAETTPLSGTTGARSPFFSPDGQWVGFGTPSGLQKLSLRDGHVEPIHASGPALAGAEWLPDGRIIFGDDAPSTTVGIRRVAASGGDLEELTRPDRSAGDLIHFAPQMLPGTRTLLYSAAGFADNGRSYRLMVKPENAPARVLVDGATRGQFDGNGHLIYRIDSSLFATSFNPHTLELGADRTLLLDSLSADPRERFSWAQTGDVLVTSVSPASRRVPTWVGRDGRVEPLPIDPAPYLNPHLSPDGERVFLTIEDGLGADAWLYDIQRDVLTRLTSGGMSRAAQWTPDGERFTVSRYRGAANDVYLQRLDGVGGSQELWKGTGATWFGSWAPGMTAFVINAAQPGGNFDVWIGDPARSDQRRPLIATAAHESAATVSPDGRWLSYLSDVSGRHELYVTPFPDGGARWQITTDGATEPLWSKDGRELFYRDGNRLLSVPIEIAKTFRWGKPRVVIEGDFFQQPGQQYDVTPDGQRFLFLASVDADPSYLRLIRPVSDFLQRSTK